jgi:hypothetical protein
VDAVSPAPKVVEYPVPFTVMLTVPVSEIPASCPPAKAPEAGAAEKDGRVNVPVMSVVVEEVVKA